MSKAFRDYEKESLELRVPVEVATEVRKATAVQRRSISHFGTEALLRALGIDPKRFGIGAEESTPPTI